MKISGTFPNPGSTLLVLYTNQSIDQSVKHLVDQVNLGFIFFVIYINQSIIQSNSRSSQSDDTILINKKKPCTLQKSINRSRFQSISWSRDMQLTFQALYPGGWGSWSRRRWRTCRREGSRWWCNGTPEHQHQHFGGFPIAKLSIFSWSLQYHSV